jgi:ABC-type sugar transport system substrate-binding protein
MVKACNDAGIPVICNSSDINANVVSKVLRDDLDLGRTSGENAAMWINANLNGKAKIAMLNFRSFSNTVAWEDGFKEKIQQISPGSEFIATIEATSREAGLIAMEDILQAHPEVNFVWAVNDPAGLGAIQAIEAANRKNVFVTFMCGGDNEAFERLTKGTNASRLVGILQIYPYEDGRISARVAVDAANKRPVDKLVNTKGVWWDERNVRKNLAAYPKYPVD